MANIYVRSTDGSDSDDGSTWALSKATLIGAAATAAAGDNVYVSDAHNTVVNTNSVMAVNFGGTPSNPVKVFCVDDAAEPPTALANTGSVENQGASGNLYLSGNIHAHGLNFATNTGGTTLGGVYLCNQNIAVDNNAPRQVFENCKFTINTTSPGARIYIGRASNVPAPEVVMINPLLKFTNAGQAFSITRGVLRIRGGSIDPTGASTTCLLDHTVLWQGTGARAEIEAMDLSHMSASASLGEFGPFAEVNYVFRNCKMPAGWTGEVASGTPLAGQRISAYNCDSIDTTYRMLIADYSGKISSNAVNVKAGGATDGTTQLAWKLESNANASFSAPLITDEILRAWPGTSIEDGDWTEGASVTISVDVLHDSVTALTNADLWMEVQFLDDAGSPLGTVTSTRKGLLAAAADIAANSSTWTTTGLTNPNRQRMSVTITPEQKGLISVKLHLAKASTIVFVDPKLVVA